MVDAIHALFNHKPLRRILLKSRVLLVVLALVAVIAWSDPRWFWPGLIVSAAGELLQLWCFACLRKDSVLSINGPYSLCRNPMYIGRFFLILGGVMLLGNPWFVAGYALLYWFYVVNRVAREERKLEELLGEPYAEYCRHVRRFVPRLHSYPGACLLFFDVERSKKNNALQNALSFAAGCGVAYYLTFVYELPSRIG